MITCQLCGTANSDLTTVCRSCKSYLQGKIDALDLFSTVWMLIESPERALRRIALARHKNYAFVISGMWGVAWTFLLFWLMSIADAIPNLFILIVAALGAGPPAGIAAVGLMALTAAGVSRVLKGASTVRNVFAVIAYSMVPSVLSLLFVLPVALGVFGSFLFGTNPPPAMLNGPVYYTLFIMTGTAVVWSFLLLAKGSSVAGGVSRGKGALTAFSVAAVFSLTTAAIVLGGASILGTR